MICIPEKRENEMVLASVKAALPTLMSQYTYDEFNRMFETPSYVTDRAAYYQGARISDKIAIVFNLAHGYYYTFLNGVRIYGSDGHGKAKLLAEKIFPMYEGAYWCDRVGREVSEHLLCDYIQNQCAVLGIPCHSLRQVQEAASAMVGETLLVTERIGKLADGSAPAAICG